jgi:glyoxylase I family protein
MKLSIEHLGLAARDPVVLRDWYVRVLSAREVFCSHETPPAFLLALPTGPMLEIYPANSEEPGARGNQVAGWRHLAVRVDSIESARAELASRGVTFDEAVKPAGGGGRVLFLRDPEGNLLHFVERPPDSPLGAAPR